MGNPTNQQRDIDTDLIRKALDRHESRQRPSGEAHREHDSRILRIEETQGEHQERLREHDTALNAGQVTFAEIRKDLAQIMLALAELKAQLAARPADLWTKVSDASVFWAVPLVLGSLLWAIVKSGQVPGVHQ